MTWSLFPAKEKTNDYKKIKNNKYQYLNMHIHIYMLVLLLSRNTKYLCIFRLGNLVIKCYSNQRGNIA